MSILLRTTQSFVVVCSLLGESSPSFRLPWTEKERAVKNRGGKNGVTKCNNGVSFGSKNAHGKFDNNTRRVCTPTTPTVRKRERTHESVPTRRRRATGVCFKYRTTTTTTTKTTTRTTKEQRRHRRTGPPGALTRFFTTTATRTIIITKRSSTEIIYVSARSRRRRRRSLCVYSSVAATKRMPLPWSL